MARSRIPPLNNFGPQRHNGRRNVGAVGITERNRRGDAVFLARRLDEISKLVGTPPHIVFVEHAFGQSAEEARHPVFEDFAAWRQQGRTGRDCLA
jgi:hypothetical protein